MEDENQGESIEALKENYSELEGDLEGSKGELNDFGLTGINIGKGLVDLGYYKIEDLKFINTQEAFYVFKIKINTNLYTKNEITEYGPKGEAKIRERYSYHLIIKN